MPKRSNEFQELIYILQSHMAPGAVVEESAMLEHQLTGEKREVDVCIRSGESGYSLIVSVECRAHKRPQSVGWIEEMHSKHQHLPTNLLVLASSSGFSKTALTLAAKFGIQTAVPGSLPDSFGDTLQSRLDKLWFKSATFKPNRVVATVQAGEDQKAFRLSTDHLLLDENGLEVSTTNEYARRGTPEFRADRNGSRAQGIRVPRASREPLSV
jgi:hypothetical protein